MEHGAGGPIEPRSTEQGSTEQGSTEQNYGPGIGRYVVPGLAVAGLVTALSPLLDGHVGPAVTAGCWVTAIGVAAHLVFARPSIRLDAFGVTLRNPLRDVVVPWPVLVEVRTRGALTLVTAQGSYVSWAAAAAGRPRGLHNFNRVLETRPDDVVLPPGAGRDGVTAVPASRGLQGDAGAAAVLVESAWARWRQDGARQAARMPGGTTGGTGGGTGGGTVRITWRLGLPAVGVAAGVLALLLELVVRAVAF